MSLDVKVVLASACRNIERAIKEFIEDLQRIPLRYFSLSRVGADFLKFVDLGPGKEPGPQPLVS